ncbi:MAG: hypothetical protein AB7R00_28815 [Kofleriaceae bacterium]
MLGDLDEEFVRACDALGATTGSSDGGRFSIDQLVRFVTNEPRPITSFPRLSHRLFSTVAIAGIATSLLARGYLHRLGPEHYVLTERARTALTSEPTVLAAADPEITRTDVAIVA